MDRELEIMKSYRKLNDALKVTVKIDHAEVLKIVVDDLIKKRNCPTNKVRDSFDDVLRYYLDEDEFVKYVLNGEKLGE